MLFKDIIGQENIKRHLIKTVADNRISHAQLFVGSEGSGNLALALAYAQYICCENKTETDSCGHCKSCVKFQKLIHPDLHFAFPVNTTKKIKQNPVSDNFISLWREKICEFPYLREIDWYEYIGIENKQGNINKFEADLIQQKMLYKPYESDYKFVLIWLPERMNTTAANKLLKLIEEPPQNTVFLLVSNNIDNIIKTILSRTQIIQIPPIDTQSMGGFLLRKYNLSDNEMRVLTRLSEGDILKAVALYGRQETEHDFFEDVKQIMRCAYRFNFVEMLNWAENISKHTREQQKSFISYIQKIVRECFMVNMGIGGITYNTDDEMDFVLQFSRYVTPNNINQFYAELNLAMAHIEQNVTQRIVFSDLAIIFGKLIKRA